MSKRCADQTGLLRITERECGKLHRREPPLKTFYNRGGMGCRKKGPADSLGGSRS